MAWKLTRTAVGTTNTEERRSEPRAEAQASVVITPLAAVGTRFEGSVVDLSTRGVRVHLETQLQTLPRVGEVFRVQGRDDIMLCEVRHAEVSGSGADVGLQVVHWSKAGELKRLIQDEIDREASARPAMSIKRLVELATWFTSAFFFAELRNN
jgi:hypothetical protein